MKLVRTIPRVGALPELFIFLGQHAANSKPRRWNKWLRSESHRRPRFRFGEMSLVQLPHGLIVVRWEWMKSVFGPCEVTAAQAGDRRDVCRTVRW
jgi:hypothetical protein